MSTALISQSPNFRFTSQVFPQIKVALQTTGYVIPKCNATFDLCYNNIESKYGCIPGGTVCCGNGKYAPAGDSCWGQGSDPATTVNYCNQTIPDMQNCYDYTAPNLCAALDGCCMSTGHVCCGNGAFCKSGQTCTSSTINTCCPFNEYYYQAVSANNAACYNQSVTVCDDGNFCQEGSYCIASGNTYLCCPSPTAIACNEGGSATCVLGSVCPSSAPVISPTGSTLTALDIDIIVICVVIFPLVSIACCLLVYCYYKAKARDLPEPHAHAYRVPEAEVARNGMQMQQTARSSADGGSHKIVTATQLHPDGSPHQQQQRRNYVSLGGIGISGVGNFSVGSTAGAGRSSTDDLHHIQIPVIEWSQIYLSPGGSGSEGETAEDEAAHVLGKGSFGVVIVADLAVQSDTAAGAQGGFARVAVKILTQSSMGASDDATQKKVLAAAIKETRIVRSVEERIQTADLFVRVYGVAQGSPPLAIRRALRISEFSDVIGIVMRFEAGGSLQSLIHKTSRDLVPLPLLEKLRLLKQIARGLAELHAIGMVHADIKPDNVLLSGDSPPQVRLADFGLAEVRGEALSVNMSTLQETKHARGTPLYSAPELLFNPFDVDESDSLAKPSRKSDVYAFALVCWELLAEQHPFQAATTEFKLAQIIHQGQRPAIADLYARQPDCPRRVVEMIEACWDKDRGRRKLASECFSILQYHHGVLSKIEYDVFISHDGGPVSVSVCSALSLRLIQAGYRVCFSDSSGGELTASADTGDAPSPSNARQPSSPLSYASAPLSQAEECVAKSKVFLLLASVAYQRSADCMRQLRMTKRVKPEPPVIPLFAEPDYMQWSSPDLKFLCQLLSTTLVTYDISEALQDAGWISEEGPGEAARAQFDSTVEAVARTIKVFCEVPVALVLPMTSRPLSTVRSPAEGSDVSPPLSDRVQELRHNIDHVFPLSTQGLDRCSKI